MPADAERERTEQQLRDAFAREDLDVVATHLLRDYGPELLGYLHAIARSPSDASEAFALFCENLWRGLPKFRGDSSFRTWAYTLARHAGYRHARDPHRNGRVVGLSQSTGMPDELAQLAERVHTTTMMHLRTEVKDELAEIRAELDQDDQSLLVLRVDRGLDWRDIAQIFADRDNKQPSTDELQRIASRLRKRFERLKLRLRARFEARHADA